MGYERRKDPRAVRRIVLGFDAVALQSSHPWPEPPSPRHIISILVAKSLHEFLFLDPCSSNDKAERKQAGQEEKPIGRHQASTDDSDEERQIERMPDVPIRAGRDEGMILPRDHGVRQVPTKRLEGPNEQYAPDCD